MLALTFIKWCIFFPSACVLVRSIEEILISSVVQAEQRLRRGLLVDTFEMGGFFLALVWHADVPGQMLLAKRAPCCPANTRGSRSYARAKGREWLRQYVIWLSSPGNRSLKKDTQFVLCRSGAEPMSGSGEMLLAWWQTPAPPMNTMKPECAPCSASAALTYC